MLLRNGTEADAAHRSVSSMAAAHVAAGPWQVLVQRRRLMHAGITTALCSATSLTLLAACGSGGSGGAGAEVAGARTQRAQRLQPSPSGSAAPPAVQLPVDADTADYQQQRPLSCEAAALHTALRLLGIDLPEAAIIDVEPRDPDPNKGFRGSLDANQDLENYGIHAPGLLQTIEQLKADGALSKDVRGTLLHSLDEARAALAGRQPVIVWIPLQLMPSERTPVTLPSGATVNLVEHEHTVTLRGYDGDQYLALDPFDGSQPSYPAGALAQAMRLFDDPALAVARDNQAGQ